MDFEKIKRYFLMLIFAGLMLGSIQIAALWAWVVSSNAIPPTEGIAYIVAGLIAAVFAGYGFVKVMTS